jgi:poly-gamma-glutamate synthesis protein (capsule biosynthesis protein)
MALSMVLVGDVNLKADLRMRADRALALVHDELAGADVRLGNLEGCFSDPSVELAYKPFWHHVEPEMAEALRGRFDVLGCANNVHYGDAIVDSVAKLDELGIAHTGAGRDRAAARRPAVVERAGKRIGMLAYTSVFWPVGAAATATTPGVSTIKAHVSYQPPPRALDMPGQPAIVRTHPDPAELAEACEEIRRLRERVDVLVVYCHWGVALAEQPSEYQHTIGRAAIDSGADLVVGSSPHVPQGVERHGRGLILHSLGNFIFGAAHHREFSRTGLLTRVTMDDDGLASATLVPVARNDDDQAELLPTSHGEGAEIAQRVVELSAAMDAALTVTDDGIQVKL